jgi:hypothetical protein
VHFCNISIAAASGTSTEALVPNIDRDDACRRHSCSAPATGPPPIRKQGTQASLIGQPLADTRITKALRPTRTPSDNEQEAVQLLLLCTINLTAYTSVTFPSLRVSGTLRPLLAIVCLAPLHESRLHAWLGRERVYIACHIWRYGLLRLLAA